MKRFWNWCSKHFRTLLRAFFAATGVCMLVKLIAAHGAIKGVLLFISPLLGALMLLGTMLVASKALRDPSIFGMLCATIYAVWGAMLGSFIIFVGMAEMAVVSEMVLLILMYCVIIETVVGYLKTSSIPQLASGQRTCEPTLEAAALSV